MPYGADVVSIAATTSGVTGTISVPSGARLKNLTMGTAETTNTAVVITSIELTWVGSPTPLRFVPNMWGFAMGTPAASAHVELLSDEDLQIPLDVRVAAATLVTIKVTSTGNETVKIGLEWD